MAMLGWHLIVDGKYEQAFTIELVEKLLRDIVKGAEMDIIAGPLSVKGAEYNEGVSSIAVIEYSTISIHTFDESRHIAIDLYSCKPYDVQRILDIIKSYNISVERTSYVLRGLNHEISSEKKD